MWGANLVVEIVLIGELEQQKELVLARQVDLAPSTNHRDSLLLKDTCMLRLQILEGCQCQNIENKFKTSEICTTIVCENMYTNK